MTEEQHGQMRYSIWVSCAEIYNENIYDLLETGVIRKGSKKVALQLKEDQKGLPYIRGISPNDDWGIPSSYGLADFFF